MSASPAEPFKITLDSRKILSLASSIVIIVGSSIYNIEKVGLPSDRNQLFDCLATMILINSALITIFIYPIYDAICHVMFATGWDKVLIDTRPYVCENEIVTDKLMSRKNVYRTYYILISIFIYIWNFVVFPGLLTGQITIDQPGNM